MSRWSRRLGLLTIAALACAQWASAAAPPVLQISKAEQRRLGIQTQLAQAAADDWRAARVLADPSRRWLAMADQAGVIEPPAQGFAKPGDTVRAGDVLAWLRPSLSELERRDLQSQRRLVQRDFDLAQVQLKRFDIDAAQALDVNLPTPSIQIIADYQSSQTRAAVLDELLGGRIAVRAPASGVLLENRARSQAVASAGLPLFEGSGDAALAIELITAQDTHVSTAQLRTHRGGLLQLQRRSASYDPALRAWRLLYGPAAGAEVSMDLLPGEPVQLRLLETASPLRLPRSSVFHHQAQAWVWVHEDAERYVARPVQLGVVDAQQQSIVAGLSPQDRVVVDAQRLQTLLASLLIASASSIATH